MLPEKAFGFRLYVWYIIWEHFVASYKPLQSRWSPATTPFLWGVNACFFYSSIGDVTTLNTQYHRDRRGCEFEMKALKTAALLILQKYSESCRSCKRWSLVISVQPGSPPAVRRHGRRYRLLILLVGSLNGNRISSFLAFGKYIITLPSRVFFILGGWLLLAQSRRMRFPEEFQRWKMPTIYRDLFAVASSIRSRSLDRSRRDIADSCIRYPPCFVYEEAF